MSEGGESPDRIPSHLSPELDTPPSTSDNVNDDIDEVQETTDNSESTAATAGTSAEKSDIDAEVSAEEPNMGAETPAADTNVCLKSMFRLCNVGTSKKVQFADEKELVCYGVAKSPEHQRKALGHYTKEQIIERYTMACTRVHIVVQNSIINQLQLIQCNTDYSAILNLSGIVLDSEIVDTIEPLLDMVTFQSIILDKGASGYFLEMCDMLEYYDPVQELILMEIDRIDNSIYRSLSNVLTNAHALRAVSFRDMSFGDSSLRILFEDGFNCGYVKRLRFDACGLNRTPTFMLAHHLKTNLFIQELHLCYLDLYSREAETIGKYLSANSTLKVLDVSNNKLGDKGVEVLCRGIFDQSLKGAGLKVLIVCNNNLTKRCFETINTIILACPLVEIINMGNNELTDEFIYQTKESIEKSTTLTSLGLQSTLVTCHGILVLAEALQINKSLRNLNLRGNKAIQPASLNTLADVIHKTSLIQIDLDDTNRTCSNPQTFSEIVNKVRQVVAVNKTQLREESQEEPVHDNWLSCEPAYVPKSSLRITRSGYSNRFTVAPVSEKVSSTRSSTGHRFTVVPAGNSDMVMPTSTTSQKRNVPKTIKKVGPGGDGLSSVAEDEHVTASLSTDKSNTTGCGDNIISEDLAGQKLETMILTPEKIEPPIIVSTTCSDVTITEVLSGEEVEKTSGEEHTVLITGDVLIKNPVEDLKIADNTIMIKESAPEN